jgi:hypothetical protein
MEKEPAFETLVNLSHLTQLSAQQNYTELSRHENCKTNSIAREARFLLLLAADMKLKATA